MTPDQVVASTRREIAERFAAYDMTDVEAKADDLIRYLLRRGWRVRTEVVDRPGPRGPGRSEVAQQLLAEARAAVEAKRGNRPELPPSCGAEHHPDQATTVYCRQPAGHNGDHRSVDGQDVWS